MYNDGQRITYDDARSGIETTLRSLKHFETGFDNIEIEVLDSDAALVSFTFRDSIVTASDSLIQARGPTTMLWKKIEGNWLITFAHADHYPVE